MKKMFLRRYLFLFSSLPVIAMDPPLDMVQSLKPVFLWTLSVKNPMAACYTKDGERLIVGSTNQLTVCNAREFILHQTDYSPGALKIDTSPSDAERIAVGSSPKNPASIWSLQEQAPKLIAFLTDARRRDAEPNINSVQYGCCGRALLVTNNNECELWDLETKKISHAFGVSAGKAVDAQWNPRDLNCFTTIAQKTTEKEVVSTLTVWDIRMKDPVVSRKDGGSINKVYYDNAGSQLICTTPGQFMQYDAKTLTLLHCLSLDGRIKPMDRLPLPSDNGHNASALQFLPNSEDIFFAGLDDASVVCIDLAGNNKQTYRFKAVESNDEISGLAINPQQHKMAATLRRSDLVKIWDISNAKALVEARSKQADAAKEWCSLL